MLVRCLGAGKLVRAAEEWMKLQEGATEALCACGRRAAETTEMAAETM